MSNKLSIVIIAGNEEKIIANCLNSVKFADEVIVASNCTDKTLEVARHTLPNAITKHLDIPLEKYNFALGRNEGFKLATADWIFFLDCDEVVTPDLQKEIIKIINLDQNKFTNYDIPRANYFLGKRVRYGGTYPDYVKRLFKKSEFKGYIGTLHEQPQISGSGSILKNDLLHYTHRDLHSMLEKSQKWTLVEAELLYKDHHPPVVWWRFIRMMFTKFWQRLIVEQMWRDGTVGFISVIFETFDTFMIYAKLWELQQK